MAAATLRAAASVCIAVGPLLAASGGRAQVPLPPDKPASLAAPAPAEATPAPAPPVTELPPPRADQITASPPPVAPPPPADVASSPPPAAGPMATVRECTAILRDVGGIFEPAPAPAAPADPRCVVADAVKLVAAAGGADTARTVAFPDAPVMSCRLAVALVGWTRGVAAPVLAAGRGRPLSAIRTGPGFECRSRNRRPGAQLSAHGLGLAVDVAGFEFAGGGRLDVAAAGHAGAKPDPAFEAARIAACGWFTTVLGPGSDGAHADHLHLDIQLHGSSDRYRICQ